MGSNEICTIARHHLINLYLKEKKTLGHKHAKRFSSKEIWDVVRLFLLLYSWCASACSKTFHRKFI